MVLELEVLFSEARRKLLRIPLLFWSYISFVFEVATLPFYGIYDIWNELGRIFGSSEEPTKSLEDEIILVTGGGSGIGRELCLQLALQDPRATIITWDVNEARNLETYKELLKLGVPRAYAHTVDITDPDQVAAGAAQIRKEAGDVTILFNNAGVSGPVGYAWEKSPASIRRTLEVNTLGHCWTLNEFLPQMIKSGRECHVVETGSSYSWSWLGPLGSPYVASKFALRGYIEGVKEDLRREGVFNVHVSLVFPHFVRTSLTAGLEMRSRKYPFLLKYLDVRDVGRKMVAGMLNHEEYIYVPGGMRLLHFITNIATPGMLRKLGDIFDIDGTHTEE